MKITFAMVILAIIGSIFLNKEINRVESEDKDLRETFDLQEAQLDSLLTESFDLINPNRDITTLPRRTYYLSFEKIISGEYSGEDGSLLAWIQKHKPNLSEAECDAMVQEILRIKSDYIKEQSEILKTLNSHDQLRNTYLGKAFVRDKPLFFIPILKKEE